MTRFARAKGSKSSNEKAPENSTPWEVMKEQLLHAKKDSEDAAKRKEAEKQRIENYENFLKERRVEKRPATWCDFPETEGLNQSSKNIQNGEAPSKKKKKNKNKAENKVNDERIVDESVKKIKKKKNKTKLNNKPSSDTNVSDGKDNVTTLDKHSVTEQVPIAEKPNKKKKKKQKHAQNINNISNLNDDNTVNNKNEHIDSLNSSSGKKLKNDKKQFNKNKPKPDPIGNEAPEIEQPNNIGHTQNQAKPPKKKKKLINGKPVRRKDIDDNSFQIIINGKEVELMRFDGFPVMKKDAERLGELKNSMIKKGIPKSEVQRTMKLERRRAEKALARVRREVCYNCRKGGHNLSDCPELKSKIPGANVADGVCFKCGSTEHRQFECKVQRDKEFRFATCFICKESGHIARQCPDNPKGLYPNGGCCKLCGDVTHMRKDCPTTNNKKEETSVKLQTLDSSENIEDIGASNKQVIAEESFKKPKKIKF